MATCNNGGPAFPNPDRFLNDSRGNYANDLYFPQLYGMSLRDWFAGKALAGILAAEADGNGYGVFKIVEKEREPQFARKIDVYAKYAYLLADAMIEARDKYPIRPPWADFWKNVGKGIAFPYIAS